LRGKKTKVTNALLCLFPSKNLFFFFQRNNLRIILLFLLKGLVFFQWKKKKKKKNFFTTLDIPFLFQEQILSENNMFMLCSALLMLMLILSLRMKKEGDSLFLFPGNKFFQRTRRRELKDSLGGW